MSFQKTVTLSSGAIVPQIGLGTWLSKPKEVEHAVEYAVRNGYRHLDLAKIYENQDEVGAALKKVIPSVVKREELFITSKLWNTGHSTRKVAEAELDSTLKELGIDYLDLYLIHWPVSFAPGDVLVPLLNENEVKLDLETSIVDTWKILIELKATGKVKNIGVSNFTVEYIQALIDATGVVPVANQIEAHPYLPQDALVKYAKEKNIHITAYSPLGNNLVGKPKLTEHDTVIAVADKLGATPAQVLVAWGVYRGYSVIPKSVQEERIVSNFKQVELSKEDYEAISSIGHGNHVRFNIPYNYKPHWEINIFDEPSEKAAKNRVKI